MRSRGAAMMTQYGETVSLCALVGTLKTLATWRCGKTKTELWVLFPEPALERVLGLRFGQSCSVTDLMAAWLLSFPRFDGHLP